MNGNYAESIELYEQTKRFTSDEYLYTSLGGSYRAVKDFRMTEGSYLHASFIVPHKFYPLYLLAKRYDENGDNEKARIIARSVMNKKVKVASKAVQEILEEMKEILYRH
jgi:tetratricopeptide (TPR) repeat protein